MLEYTIRTFQRAHGFEFILNVVSITFHPSEYWIFKVECEDWIKTSCLVLQELSELGGPNVLSSTGLDGPDILPLTGLDGIDSRPSTGLNRPDARPSTEVCVKSSSSVCNNFKTNNFI